MKCLTLATLTALATIALAADYFHEYQRSVEVICKNYNLNFTELVFFQDKSLKYDSIVRLQISPKHKGYGLFANRRIKKGELVMKEHPLFLIPAAWYEKTESEFSALMQEHVFPTMSEDEFMEFLRLADAFPDDQSRPILNRLVYSNVFDLDDQIGMFLKISRINHSCKPSILYSYINGLMLLYAARDIEVNEELHLSYVDTLISKAERQQHLLNDYGFVCDCELCSANLTDDAQKKHDENRLKLNEIYLFNSSDQPPEENIKHLEHLLELTKEEDVSHDLAVTGHIYYELLESLTQIPDYFKKYNKYNVSEIGRQVYQSFSIVYGSEFVYNLFQQKFPDLPSGL